MVNGRAENGGLLLSDVLILTTAGNVDDGKSTLIGRLIYDCQWAFSDQLKAAAYKEKGLNLAFLTDGLKQEQDEGITIDVAHRYFQSSKRRFVLRDSPGHGQFTKNFVTAASSAQVVILVVDASRELAAQTARHLNMAALLNLEILVCINKMDLVDFRQTEFQKIVSGIDELYSFTGKNKKPLKFVPVVATEGDNVASFSTRMPWYSGPTVLSWLEKVKGDENKKNLPLRFSVQLVGADGGLMGEIIQGSIATGNNITLPSKQIETQIEKIYYGHELVSRAEKGQAVRVYLQHSTSIKRGDILYEKQLTRPSSSLRGTLFWLGLQNSSKDSYLIRHGTRLLQGHIDKIFNVFDFEFKNMANSSYLKTNDVGEVSLKMHESIFSDSYSENAETGSLLLIDPQTHETAGALLIS